MSKNGKARRKQQLDPRWVIGGALVLILAIVAIMIVTREESNDTEAAAVAQAEDFTLPNFDGDQVSLADFRGQYVLVNFWASWCPPCKREMPDLHAYYEDYKDEGFTVLAVSTNDEMANALEFVETNDLTFPVVLDFNAVVYDKFKAYALAEYGTSGLPTSYLISPDGQVVKVWQPGMITRAELERDVTPLLKS